jgi:hypothetical protein
MANLDGQDLDLADLQLQTRPYGAIKYFSNWWSIALDKIADLRYTPIEIMARLIIVNLARPPLTWKSHAVRVVRISSAVAHCQFARLSGAELDLPSHLPECPENEFSMSQNPGNRILKEVVHNAKTKNRSKHW